jgi:DNA primase
MLLLHSDWWQQLDADDHELLAGLPPLHGPLCGWLERYLHEHGPTSWAVLEHALHDTEWADAALRLVPQSVLADEMQFADLRRVVDGMWIRSLQTQQEALIQQVATDPLALTRWRELEARRKQLLTQAKQPTLT